MSSTKIKNKIKITQISDLHSNTIKNMDFFMEKIKDFDPDFLILTGDINDYGEKVKIAKTISFIEKLKDIDKKIYYILGNHEERGPLLNEFLQRLRANKVIILRNSDDLIEVNGNLVYIFGSEYFGFDYSTFKARPEYVNIVLAHHSKCIRDNYNGKEDFVFSGHTHGGQVRLPFIGALWAPGEGFFPKYDKGVFAYKNFKIYIDSGMGNTKYNLRFLNRIQFSNITLKGANSLKVE
ncbi:MAG: metallophosphoesterase [Peptoniphilaceae bacterium]|nr:metallophosphoesterase [Peptoniphilaceae bacterium]MDY6019237.1 metallophosphoesterase [Anaerococcus sp.]